MTQQISKDRPQDDTHEMDLLRLRHYMQLSAHEKLCRLAAMQEFLRRVMPERNKQIAARLRQMGF